MKKQILTVLGILLTFYGYAQISFEKGYYIDNNGEKIECSIKNVDWRNNPAEFEYMLTEGGNVQKSTIESVKEFGINNFSKYVRSTVEIDRSSSNVNDLSSERAPKLEEETLFLKVLVEGEAILYEYIDDDLVRYFYSKGEQKAEQLIFKLFRPLDSNTIGKNQFFRQQLWNNLKCPNIPQSKIEGMYYKKKELVKFFVAYNQCNNSKAVSFEAKQKQERDVFNLTFRPRLNVSSLNVQGFGNNSITNNSLLNADFGSKASFGFGAEAEFILPFNKNKWAIIIEPTYQYFNKEKSTESTRVSGGSVTATVDYKSFEIPLGVRHYFFLNTDSKLFVNVLNITDFTLSSEIVYTGATGATLQEEEINTKNNFAFGLGYNYLKKYSIELRYLTERELLNLNANYNAGYNTLSLIFGISFF